MIGDTSRAGWADRPVGMTVLVTGASGTLGSVVLPRLAEDGHEVRPISRTARDGWIVGDPRTGAGPMRCVAWTRSFT